MIDARGKEWPEWEKVQEWVREQRREEKARGEVLTRAEKIVGLAVVVLSPIVTVIVQHLLLAG